MRQRLLPREHFRRGNALTVDRRSDILAKKAAHATPGDLLGSERADLHLGHGNTDRPDTLTQTAQLRSK